MKFRSASIIVELIRIFLILFQAEGHIITCETITGEVYRGKLIEAEDNMNCQMTGVQVTYRDGRVANLENIYIRGSKIRFLILPHMLKNAPMFKNMGRGRGAAAGTAGASRGKSAILRAQAARGRGRAVPGGMPNPRGGGRGMPFQGRGGH